jgi:hypothetical protein
MRVVNLVFTMVCVSPLLGLLVLDLHCGCVVTSQGKVLRCNVELGKQWWHKEPSV